MAAPAHARSVPLDDPAWTYVQARAAAISGNPGRSAELLASLAQNSDADTKLVQTALSEAIGSGKMDLALRLAKSLPPPALSVDARILLVTDALQRNDFNGALGVLEAMGQEGNLAFLAPLVRAWAYAERGDARQALAVLGQIPANGAASPYRDENQALILLKLRRSAEAEPFARRAIAAAGPRETRLRLALAESFLRAGDKARARAMVDGIDSNAAFAADRVRAGKSPGVAIDTAAKAFSQVLLDVASDLSRMNNRELPLGMVQISRFADPANGDAAVLLALILEEEDRTEDALAVLRSVGGTDPLRSTVLDTRVRILGDSGRRDEAIALARAAVARDGAGVDDWARLGDMLQDSDRHGEAVDAYAQALALARGRVTSDEMWRLYLLQATALEESDRWPEAKQALETALTIAPEQPLLLNFLGYAKLERGEDLDSAEAMIRKAVELAPDNASITDSLGWALYKRGRYADAIATLEKAAAGDPTQWEIHEHLGDALYASGRRYEARYAWNAALITAEDDAAARLRAKLVAGLTPATAAP